MILAIPIAVAVAILVAAPEALAKVVVVGILVDIIAVIAVVRVLICEGVLIAGTPAILPVCRSGVETFRITIVHGLPE